MKELLHNESQHSDASPTLHPEERPKKSVSREIGSIHHILNSDSDNDGSITTGRRRSSVDMSPLKASEDLDRDPQQTKRGRGRPRKHNKDTGPKLPKRPRGRPRKSVTYDSLGLKSVCDNYIALSNALLEKIGTDDRMPQFTKSLVKSRNLVQLYLVAIAEEDILTDAQVEEIENQALNVP